MRSHGTWRWHVTRRIRAAEAPVYRHAIEQGAEAVSTIQVSPYINFQGRAREAMELYHTALGGRLDLYSMNAQGQTQLAGPDDRISHAQLDADGAVIVGSDGHPKFPPTVGDNFAVALSGSDGDRLAAAFSALAEGGQVKGPLHEQPSGAKVGYLVDKFGVNWIVTINNA
jgi:PhnB protein